MESLTTITGQLGQHLIEKAGEIRKQRITDQCITEVQTVMSRIDAAEQRIEADTALLALLKKQLEAIGAGAFTMRRDPSSHQVVILYNDDALIETGSMAELMKSGKIR